ncbi:MAG: PAS domain-containing protein [Sulfurovum sp.]|nr:PAS domain-containing protein [Sulfurovum sp.]MCB4745037.1 PAS domain-containing protein [Sulfurovum sp.]MCB4746672.1 PAS domain-containing protein [Sulfurovum sp.]MCB4748043.1 PAS domain-containing protein [Sulfurovum sp.]MCB4748824.1 PAS domain-containing protein [Sulfurovum sp.]
MKQPEPINEEIILKNNVYIESDTDLKGVITYVNDYFAEISRYREDELIGQPHNIVRHPDMPCILYKILWDRIQNGQNFVAAIKNLAKDGKYYWVFTDFEILKDEQENPIGYKASRKKISKHVADILNPIYKKLVEVEKEGGMEASEKYLNNFLKSHGDDITVDNMLEEIHHLY